MPFRLPFVLVLVLALAACRTTRTPAVQDVASPGRAVVETTLLEAMEASAAAWNRGDLEGHVAMYVDDASFMTSRGPVRGRGTIRGALEGAFWQAGQPLQQLRFEELAVEPLGPDHALLTGRFVLTGGDRPDATGRFSTIWARTPDGWRIVHDHSS